MSICNVLMAELRTKDKIGEGVKQRQERKEKEKREHFKYSDPAQSLATLSTVSPLSG